LDWEEIEDPGGKRDKQPSTLASAAQRMIS